MNKTIDRLVNKFLCWKLPKDFCPDGGIFFKRIPDFPEFNKWEYEPIGTNLFTADQAKAMFEYLLADEPQALLSQGEPMGYLRFKTINDVTFVPRDVRFVLHGASPHITTYPDLPLYLVPPSTEALQKDKAELIEYAKWLIEHLFIIKNSQDSNLHRNILSSIGLAKLANDALDNPKPKCMENE